MKKELGEFIRYVNDEIFNKRNLDIIKQVFSVDYVMNDVKKMEMSHENL